MQFAVGGRITVIEKKRRVLCNSIQILTVDVVNSKVNCARSSQLYNDDDECCLRSIFASHVSRAGPIAIACFR